MYNNNYLRQSLRSSPTIGNANTLVLAGPRGAFLLLLKMNVRNLAKVFDHLLKKDPGRLKSRWNRLGGNFTTLKKAIAKGKGRRRILGTGGGIGVAIESILAAAATILAALAGLIREGKKDMADPDSDVYKDYKEDPDPEPDPEPGPEPDRGGFDTKSLLMVGAGVLLLSFMSSQKEKANEP